MPLIADDAKWVSAARMPTASPATISGVTCLMTTNDNIVVNVAAENTSLASERRGTQRRGKHERASDAKVKFKIAATICASTCGGRSAVVDPASTASNATCIAA